MSLEQLKDQIAHLAPHEQRELIAYMVSLQTQQDQDFRERLAQRIDNKNPANWIELDDLRRKFAE